MEKKTTACSCIGKKGRVAKYELSWVMALVGTGLGAGVLYLPFAIGTGGFLPILVLTIFCVPLVFLSHRNLTRVCLSPAMPGADMHRVIRTVFPRRYSAIFLLICFLSVFPTLLIYAIGITNITSSFLGNQLKLADTDSLFISAILIMSLVGVLTGGETWLLRVASAMVTPLTIIMLCLGVYLIPHWQIEFLFYLPESYEFWKVILLGLPVMTFSFYHAPMCAVMARGYRERAREHGGMSLEHSRSADYSRSADTVHLVSTALLFIVILFFVMSCLLCLTQQELLDAQHSNLPILSVLANSSGNPWFYFIAPIIAFLSIATSFFGFFLGTVELINGILSHAVNHMTGKNTSTPASVHRISITLAAVSCWVAAISNWDILKVIAGLVAPMMAIVVFFIPLFAIYTSPALRGLKNKTQDVYVFVGGAMVVIGFIISLVVGQSL